MYMISWPLLPLLFIGNVISQQYSSTQVERLEPLPLGYCWLPDQPTSGSHFSVHCYGDNSLSNECLNIPQSPVKPGWILTYICDKGFFFPQKQGYIDIRCQGGQWIPPPPRCEDQICKPPSNPPQGWYSLHPLDCVGACDPPARRLPDNALLSLHCATGYQTTVDCTALCVKGVWLEPPACIRLTNSTSRPQDRIANPRWACPLPEAPDHGTYFSPTCYSGDAHLPECDALPGSTARHSWVLTFQCDEGFLPSTNHTLSHSKCHQGQWTPPPPSCEVSLENGCQVPSEPANGHYTATCASPPCSSGPGQLVPRGQKLTLSCDQGYQPMEGYALSTCVNGTWTPPPATCADGSNDIVIHRDISVIQSQFKGCVLPEPPHHGRYNLFSPNCYGTRLNQPECRQKPGQMVPHLQVLSISCDSEYLLGVPTGSTFLVSCDDGQWNQVLPECYKPCQALKSRTVDIECYQGTKIVPCDSPMLPNTTVTSKCKLNHDTTDDPRDLVCLLNGEWSGDLPRCKPNCGLSKLNSYTIVPTIVNGSDSKLGYFPWHAGIYQKNSDERWENVCGGTLISPHIILTAAHCVTERSTKLKPEDIRVALGKYYRDWEVFEPDMVIKKIKDIQIQPNYLGQESLLELDIALMALESPVTVNSFVMPACVDYRLTHPLLPQMIGYLTGWGKTEDCSACDDGSDTLLYANTSFLTFRQCYDTMQRIHRLPFTRLTSDKFCASDATKSVAQKGDSGGGVTFVFDGVHYVKGVISAKIAIPESYSISAFTNVTHHITWIYKIASFLDTLVK